MLTLTVTRLIIPETEIILSKFQLFPKLPHELRLKIWSLAANKPRAIKLLFLDPETLPSCHHSNSKVPSVLHASQEARKEGLRYYELCYEKASELDGYLWPRRDGTVFPRGVYVNFAVDLFYHESMGDADYI